MLGWKVRDTITGFTVVVTAHCSYLGSPDRAHVESAVDDKGAFRAEWFDTSRLLRLDDTIATLKDLPAESRAPAR